MFPVPSVTEIPPAGAGALIVTVPVVDWLPRTVLGERVTLTRVGAAVTVNAADTVTPSFPVIATTWSVATAVVVIVKLAEVEWAGMVTDEATTAFAELELNATTVPPTGAGALSVIVPTADCPPTTVIGETAMLNGRAPTIAHTTPPLFGPPL